MASPLIDALSLALEIESGTVSVIDATWFLGEEDGRDTYDEGHLPGAHFFDIDAVAAPDTDLPHMLPSPEDFAAATAKMVRPGTDVVVYDASPVRSAARVWWTFKVMGIDRVRILDAGRDAWVEAGFALTREAPTQVAGRIETSPRADRVVDREELRRLLGDDDVLVLDARSEGRFRGVDPEPRPGLSSGAMRGAGNVPFTMLYEADGKLKSDEELREVFAPFELQRRKRIVASCGSGVSACSILLALTKLGHDNLAVYDGAWAEWASRGEEIVRTG